MEDYQRKEYLGKKCKDCRYFNFRESRGTIFVVYLCGRYMNYVGERDCACPAFVPLYSGGGSGCYLTTACVKYKGLVPIF